MTTIFIFHGTGGYPEENWFPWLRKKLEARGCKVIVPQFPTPENQSLENWFTVFDKYKEDFTSDTILIGHSLGGAFLLRVLERSNIRIKAAFIVSAPIGVLPIKNYEGDKPFIGHPFNWSNIKKSCTAFFIFHSDNDPYVCLGNGKELAKKVESDLIFISGSGHFNKAAGFDTFDTFEALLEKIKTVLKN
ncbi:MAG: alpha/beta fold hydrolase [Nanoarchaeota archaeon]